jgi:membrane fusion protein, multidrug efflux system
LTVNNNNPILDSIPIFHRRPSADRIGTPCIARGIRFPTARIQPEYQLVSILKQLSVIALLSGIAFGGYEAYRHFYLPDPAQATSTGTRSGPQPAPVELFRASLARTETRIEAVGSTLARRSVEIVPSTSGRVREILFEPGQMVAKDQVLATLDDDIERANLAEADATLNEAQLALDRARMLRQSSTVSQASLETLISQQAITRAALDRARRRLADREVRAPFDGMVGLARVNAGARVDDDTVITTLDDRSEIDAEFSLPETLYARVSPGLPVIARAAAFPGQRFEGEVINIDSRIDPEARSFKVRARLPNHDLVLPAGMFIHMTLSLDVRQALVIPEDALISENEATYVWIADSDDRAFRREVSVGQREASGAVEIVNGLAEGERVVVRGIQRLRDGSSLRILSEASFNDKPEDSA